MTPSLAAVPAPAPDDDLSTRLRDRRLRQVTTATLLALCASMVPDLLHGKWANVVLLGAAALVLLGVLGLSRGGHLEGAAVLLLVTLQVMVCVLAWRNGGMHDTAVLAFPGLLLFAAMLGSARLFAAMLVGTLGFIGLLYLSHVQGWHVQPPVVVIDSTLVDELAIVALTGLSAWLMAGDQRRAAARLAARNREVSELQTRTAYIATHDPLTGLPNRLLARDRFEQAVAEARRRAGRVALLYLDLDHFKNVNDSMGHASGDALLTVVAGRLRAMLRASDTVCRLGGDEFLLVVAEPDDNEAVAAIASKVVEQLASPVTVQGVEVTSGGSVGIALYPDDGADFDDLLKTADMAMYRAKEAGRNAFRFYDAEMNASVQEHVRLVAALRGAVARGEFWLAYQPQYRLEDGALVGMEALLRWRHPKLGLVSPARFIPLAERSGLIVPIGEWVLQEACRQAQAWRAQGARGLVMSVNVSPLQFRRGEVERAVGGALDRSGLPASALELELTESLLIQDSPALNATLHHLRALGVRFAIDDFGTGYSNLAYLKRFEVERLKIDQSFIRRLTRDGQDQTIVRAIVQMADGLGLATVAEGIEDAETLEALRAMGCGQGQGFHWSPGLPAAEFEHKVLAVAATVLGN